NSVGETGAATVGTIRKFAMAAPGPGFVIVIFLFLASPGPAALVRVRLVVKIVVRRRQGRRLLLADGGRPGRPLLLLILIRKHLMAITATACARGDPLPAIRTAFPGFRRRHGEPQRIRNAVAVIVTRLNGYELLNRNDDQGQRQQDQTRSVA